MNTDPPLRLPPRTSDAHKGDFGKLLLVGGSRGMSGSIALASMAALHTGSGLVSAAVPDRCLETVASFHPGVMTIPISDNSQGRFSLDAATELSGLINRFDVIGCGPGMTTGEGSYRIVERLLQQKLPRVFDADALNCLAQIDLFAEMAADHDLVLTPHPGEFSRLSGVSASDRGAQIDAAKSIANSCRAVIVLKGGPTVIIGSADRTDGPWTNTTGNAGMATAGSGDVLTGVITSLLGQGLSAWNAARLGVWIHGAAGDIAAQRLGQAGMTCLDIVAALPEATRAAESSVTEH